MEWFKLLKAKAHLVSNVRYEDRHIGNARNAPTTFLIWDSNLDRFDSDTLRGKIQQWIEDKTELKVLDFDVKESGLEGP